MEKIIFIFAGILLITYGAIILNKKMVKLIAGYKEENIKDKNGLIKWVGINFCIMGVISCLISFAGIIIENYKMIYMFITFFSVIVIMCIIIVIGIKKYEL